VRIPAPAALRPVEARFEPAGFVTAKLSRIPNLYSLGPEAQGHKHGFIQKLTKGKWTDKALLATNNNQIPEGVLLNVLMKRVNKYLREQPDYDRGDVDKMMISRSLKRLRRRPT
jgi:hypothetical protein